jgi:hypothetical protein
MDFYSYLWLREDGTPYYAGKGHGSRAFVRGTHRYVYPPRDKTRIVVFILHDEAEAFESEIALIDLFGRKDLGTGCLLNQTSGGEGVPHQFYSAELREKLRRAAQKSRPPLSAAHKEKLRILRTGTKLSQNHKEKISASLIGNQYARGKHWRWHQPEQED